MDHLCFLDVYMKIFDRGGKFIENFISWFSMDVYNEIFYEKSENFI